MSLPNGFEEFVRLLRNSVDEMKQLGRAITAERGTEPTPYVGVETDDPITVSRRKLNVWLEQLEGYYGDHRDISDSPHIHLIAWIQSNVRSYFDSPEVDYCRVTIVDDREEYGELEFERLAYFHFEANLPFRFETPKFEGCVASFERYLSVCDSLLSNSEFVYFINSFGELTETDESEGGSRDIPSAKYALPKPGRNGGGKVTRNSLRKVILMFEQHRHSRGHRPTDQQIANHHNKHYPNQPRATAKIVSDARRRLRVKGILGWE